MHPSLRVLAEHVHKPLIRFIGKRKWPTQPEAPHAHPAAPPELKKAFGDFAQRFQSSESAPSASSTATSAAVADATSPVNSTYEEFWDAPPRVWNPRVRELNQAEIDAILSGGATLR